MKNVIQIVCVVVIVGMGSAASARVNIETVHVGNPGNAGEQSRLGDGDTAYYGAVAYEYNIGKYEVTAGQYCEFLNAVDPTGSNSDGLYSDWMNNFYYGCQITWNSGSSTYDFSGGRVEAPGSTAADWENRPVNYVSWYDAAMFANYLTSGNVNNGAYDTSAGAGWGAIHAEDYTGTIARDSAAMDTLVGTYGKVYVIPTEDEWYKAAYYSGSGSTYYDYPTSSNAVPGYVNDRGKLSGTGTPFTDGVTDPGNYVTHDGDAGTDGIGPDYYRTEVGEWENSESPYGTFDQGGNVWEWNEVILRGIYRGLRGGSFRFSERLLEASYRDIFTPPTYEGVDIGFRVFEISEPATPGDTNGDHIVDAIDLANLIAQFGSTPGADSADFNGDNFVDIEDFSIQRDNFGFGVVTAPGADFGAVTPEPTTLGMLALGGLAMLRRRRSCRGRA